MIGEEGLIVRGCKMKRSDIGVNGDEIQDKGIRSQSHVERNPHHRISKEDTSDIHLYPSLAYPILSYSALHA